MTFLVGGVIFLDHDVNKQDPSLLNSAANVLLPLASAS